MTGLSINILALDLSLTATGVALPDGSTEKLTTRLRGVERLAWLRTEILCRTELPMSMERVDLVVIEDYAYHGRQAHSHELGELGGVVRLALHDEDVRWVAVNPTSLKRYATGRGNAKKEEVLAAAIRRIDYGGSDHNEADGAWLRAMALDAYGVQALVPAAHREALAKVDWPDLGSVA